MGNLQLPMMIFVGSSIVAIWAYFVYFKDAVPKHFRTTLHLFMLQPQVYRIEVENHNNLMLPKTGPGYVENQSATIVRRFGRVWKNFKTDQEKEHARKRETVYVVRYNDPNPLTIGLGVENGYQGEQVDHDTFKDLSNLNQRDAAASARQQGSLKDAATNKLMIAVIICVGGGVLTWLVYLALTMINGDPS